MPGPAPKLERRRRNMPTRGEWQAAEATGWQHGKVPAPPTGLSAAARAAWRDWFASWVASFWRTDDISGLRTAILLYDKMLREPSAATAGTLGQFLDRYGLTPKGLQDRRWRPPDTQPQQEPQPTESKYRRLRVVGE